MKLDRQFYDAVVISDETDRSLSGGVRVLIIGVTDTIEDDLQPFALPAVNSFMGVPTKGSYLKVYFEDGDIHQPIYLHVSPQKSYLPDDYISNYPNVAIANLGSDFFQMLHNRQDKRTLVEHDSNSSLTWDAFGTLVHDSQNGYENAGKGAKQGTGEKIQKVLTEGTVDVFTCSMHGGGSEYLKVTHISKETVLGTIEQQQKTVEKTTASEEGTGTDPENPETRELGGVDIEYLQAKNIITDPNRKVKLVIIGNTGNNDFLLSINSLLESTISTHYVVGRTRGEVIQMIDLDKTGTFGSKGTWNKQTNANKFSISVLLVGVAASDYTEYQYSVLGDIISKSKNLYGNEIEAVTIADIDPSMKTIFGNIFDIGKIT